MGFGQGVARRHLVPAALVVVCVLVAGFAAVAFAVLGDPSATMSINNGADSTSSSPVTINSDVTDAVAMSFTPDFKQVDAGSTFACGIATDGSLWTWGYVGSTNVTRPVRVGSSNDWKCVAVGQFAAAIKNDGSLWTWYPTEQPYQLGTYKYWSSLSAGGYHMLALRTDGTLCGWGTGSSGQLGNGSMSTQYSPVVIGWGYKSIAAGFNHSSGVTTDGRLFTWGDNSYGQLGLGNTTRQNYPTLVGSGYATTTAGEYFTVASTSAGNWLSCGRGEWGQLGTGNNSSLSYFAGALGSGWTKIQARGPHAVGLKADGTLWTWGLSPAGGNSTPSQVGTSTAWTDVAAGDRSTFALQGGRLFDWGEGTWGLLADGTTTNRSSAQIMPIENWEAYSSVKNYDVGSMEGTLVVTAKYRDAGNATITLADTIYFDNKPPTGTLYVNNGATYANSLTVSLRIWVPANDVAQMSVDNGPWFTYSNESTHTMTPGEGARSVSVRLRDAAGNVGTIVDGITMDTTAPSGTMSFDSGAATTATRRPLVTSAVPGAATLMAETGQWRQLSAGSSHVLALDDEGVLWSWGSNAYGQIGDGTELGDNWATVAGARVQPTRVFSDRKWASMDAGGQFSLAIREDGLLYGWGYNANGQLGNGTLTNVNLPVAVSGDATWTAVSAGGSHSLGIRGDGTLWGWGSNGYGQLGRPVGGNYTAPVQIGGDSDWKAVAASAGGTFALKNDGSLWSCGYNWDGQLGQGTVYPTYQVTTLTRIGTDNDWSAVSSTGNHSVALKTNGTVWAWGRNNNTPTGVLGQGDTVNRPSPTQVGTDTDWVKIVAGDRNSAAIKSDGSLWTWGENSSGQLGIGNVSAPNVPRRVGTANDWDEVVYGSGDMYGLTTAGNLRGAGYTPYLATAASQYSYTYTYVPESLGWMRYGAGVPVLLSDTTGSQTIDVKYSDEAGNLLTLSDSIAIAPGSAPTMTLNDGADRTSSNYLKATAVVPGATAMRVGHKWQEVHAGFGYTTLHVKDGPVEFAGVGNMAEQGDGSLTFRTTTFEPGGMDTVWKYYSAGDQHSVAVAKDGTLWTWGYSSKGEIGIPGSQAPSPVCIDAENTYKAVAGGMHVSFAIRSDGTLWAWGLNDYGQLGDGTKTNRITPVQVGTDTDWASVSNWGAHTVGLKNDGTLMAWGIGNSGQLGQGDLLERLTPTVVQPGTQWLMAKAGPDHTIAIRSDDSLWTWGANGSGQLGDGTNTNRTLPVRVGVYPWKYVAAGYCCSLAIRADGTLWAFGNNSGAQLGDGGLTNRNTPGKIGTRNDWECVDSGGTTDFGQTTRYHSVGSTADGRIFTWGFNGWGALGDGTYTLRSSPVEAVVAPLGTYYQSWSQSYPWASGETTVSVCYTLANGSPLWLSDGIYITPPGPSISGLTPVFGSVAESSSPEISARILVNSGAKPATVEVRVDGTLVPSSYDGAITNEVSAFVGGLSDDTTHTATVKVTDAAGSTATASTSFLLEKGPRMPHWDAAADCRTCHGATVPHTNSVCYSPSADAEARCMVCHMGIHNTYPETPYPRYYECNCHYYSTAGTPNWMHRLNPATCKTCHTMFRQGQDPVPPETVRHTTEVPTCTPCHRHEVRFEHARRKTDAGVAYGCNTCHTSAVTRVQTAISANNTQCSACHDPIDHVAPHTGTVAANCQACHSGNLDEEHVTRHGLDCEVCHSSTDPAVFAAIRDHNRACTACHTGDHPHSPAAITDVLANGEKACTACHSTDLVAEHAKPTSAKTGSTCDVCHLPGGPRAQISGTWDRTCDTPACHADGSARAVHENWCLACHATTQPGFASSKTSFAVGEPVNRETACAKCHAPGMVGTHPYHQPGSNCGAACHADWGGDSLLSATPRYTDPSSGASFATATSKSQSPAQLHAIHAQRRWPANLVFAKSACSSCHAVASCAACHTGAVPATHETHSAAGGTGLSAYTPWTGEMANGVSGADQRQRTATTEPNQCASASCHNVAASATRTTRSVEDYNYVVGQNTYDPAGTNTAISTTGTWRYRASNRYTGGRMSYASTAATLSASVDGSRFEILSEKDPYRGIAEVYIDGVLEGEFDAYAAVSTNQTSVFSHPLSAGTHSVSVRWTGRGNPAARAKYVVVDAFRVQGALPESIAPTCSSCHSNRVANHW